MSAKVTISFGRKKTQEKDATMSRMISVRTTSGRVARVSPRGEFIPTDRFVNVLDTPYLRRLLSYGDIELETTKKASPPVAKLTPPASEATKEGTKST